VKLSIYEDRMGVERFELSIPDPLRPSICVRAVS
jgi:hypothetical protein